MGLTRLAISRPVAIIMLIGACVVMGLISFVKMPAELNPQVDFPTVTITTTFAGTNPNNMETLITKPIEDSISGVSGIKQINSTSQNGISVVIVQFYFGTDLNQADVDVIQKVDAIRKLLPIAADSPAVLKADTSSQPVIYYAMESDTETQSALRSLAQNVVQQALEQAPSVGSVTILGGDVREINVSVYPDRLAAMGITTTELATALNNDNLTVASGFIQKGNIYDDVRVIAEFSSLDEIRNDRLTINGKTFKVSDVADVTDSVQENTSDARVNATRAVTLVVQKTSDGNTIEAADGTKVQIKKLEAYLPKDIKFIPINDLSVNVVNNINDVVASLILGSILAILVVFLFLHNVRGTFIIGIAIPTSMIATFFPISIFGFTLNTMTLLGLSLAVGILVDDSIVVLENINRHLALGEEPEVAAINGRTEIGLAAITLTCVDLVVFLPIGFMGGVVGEFFRSFGITVAVATLFSLLVSFTLTPMLAAKWYQKGERFEFTKGFAGAFDRGFFALERFYQRTLKTILRHPWFTVFVGNLLLVAIFAFCFMVLHLGFRFAPGQDQNQVSVVVEGPPGASLTYTRKITNQIYHIIRNTPDLNHDIKFVFTNLGASQTGAAGTGLTGTEYANMSIQLYYKKSLLDTFSKEHLRTRTDVAVAAELTKLTRHLQGAAIFATAVNGFGGGGAPLQVSLNGVDFNNILSAGDKVMDLLRQTPGVYDVDISYKNSQPEVQIRIDRTKVPDFGLTVAQVANAVSDSVAGNIVSQYRDPADGQQYNIRVQLPESYRDDPAEIGNVIVGYQNGSPIILSQVADVQMGTGPVKIDRLNRERDVTVTAYLQPGYQVGNVSAALSAKLKKTNLGATTFSFGGEAQSLGDEGGFIGTALALGIVLSYMLMAALFNNMLYPLSIMLSLPQAWAGAFLALAIVGEPLSLIAMIGIVLLNAIVNKNAILMVDFTNTLRRRGYKRIDALTEAAPIRLRPIMMTTIAILVTSLPTALALGRGSGFRQSLGVTVVGGASLSLFLTLLVIPCAYVIWDDVATFIGNLVERLGSRSSGGSGPYSAPPPSSNGSRYDPPVVVGDDDAASRGGGFSR